MVYPIGNWIIGHSAATFATINATIVYFRYCNFQFNTGPQRPTTGSIFFLYFFDRYIYLFSFCIIELCKIIFCKYGTLVGNCL